MAHESNRTRWGVSVVGRSAYRRLWRDWATMMRELRAEVRNARCLLQRGRRTDIEDATAILEVARADHDDLIAKLRWLRTVKVR